MKIFIDESGDPGFKLELGSSRFFVITLIIFDDEAEANKARQALAELKKSWKKEPNFELKFTKLTLEQRVEAIKLSLNFKYKIRAVIFDKVRMNELQLEKFKRNYYQYAIRSLLERDDCYIHDAVIKIDTFGEDFYRQNLIKYFEENICSDQLSLDEILVFEDSKHDNLLQLADLVAGSLNRSFSGHSADAQVYRQIFQSHEEDIRVFRETLHSR